MDDKDAAFRFKPDEPNIVLCVERKRCQSRAECDSIPLVGRASSNKRKPVKSILAYLGGSAALWSLKLLAAPGGKTM